MIETSNGDARILKLLQRSCIVPLVTRYPRSIQYLLDELHIHIFAVVRIRKDDHDIALGHVRMLATLMRSIKTKVLQRISKIIALAISEENYVNIFNLKSHLFV